MCYHALSQWTCVLHGYFAWLYAQNLTQIIPRLEGRGSEASEIHQSVIRRIVRNGGEVLVINRKYKSEVRNQRLFGLPRVH